MGVGCILNGDVPTCSSIQVEQQQIVMSMLHVPSTCYLYVIVLKRIKSYTYDRNVISNIQDKGAFIICYNAAALQMYQLLIYLSSTQHTAPQVHFLAVPQCSSWRRDGNTTTATYCNAAAVDYECSFRQITL